VAVLETALAPVAIVDAHYEDAGARAACVVAASWTEAAAIEERAASIASVKPYRPGAFYERELPCLAAVLSVVQTTFRAVVVDGYVDLDAQGTPGLGARLHEHLGGGTVVVGVAKTAFRGSSFARQVTRGTSRSPLFVTSRGVDATTAARLVQRMHGSHRIPTLLARADRLARGAVSPARP
jgi:deoxyribonuclease V